MTEDSSFRARRFARAMDAAGLDDPEARMLVARFVELVDRLEPIDDAGAERLREAARQDKHTPASIERAEVAIALHQAQRYVEMPEGARELQLIVNRLGSLIKPIGTKPAAELLTLVATEATRAATWIKELFSPEPAD